MFVMPSAQSTRAAFGEASGSEFIEFIELLEFIEFVELLKCSRPLQSARTA